MFEAAIANSPSKSCDIVIANAGISRASGDTLWPLDGEPSTSPQSQHCVNGKKQTPTNPPSNLPSA